MKKNYFLLSFLCISVLSFAQTISIDGKTYSMDTLANFKVGPGTQYTSLRLQSNSRLDVFFLKVDAKNPFISIKTVLGRDSIYTGEQPSAMAKRKSKEGAVYFAGTNGDFYNTTGYVGYPVAGCMVESEVAKPPVTDRKVYTIDENNISGIGAMSYTGSVKFGTETWNLNTVNHLRNDNQLVLFNQHNGKVTRANAYGTEVLIELSANNNWGVNKILKAKVLKIEKNIGSMIIPKGQAVLSGHGTAAANLNKLAVNDEIELNIQLSLDGVKSSYTQVVGGDNRNVMLKNGIVETAQVWDELHPRTAIGFSQDQKYIIYCVVDGRGASAGVTTKQLAQLMQSAGAYTAFNMDGGGSSALYVKEFGPMNTGSDGTERAVANGIFAVSSAPTDNTISEIKAYNSTIKLPKFGVFMPKFLAYNQYGVLINKDLAGVTLSCEAQVGEIAADGRFIASGTQGGLVTAKLGNIETKFRVELISSAQIAFKLDSVIIDKRREYPIQIQSIIGINTMEVLPAALTWRTNDASICSIQNGILKGIKNGTTYVVGKLGSFEDSIKVKVEIPNSGVFVQDNFEVKNWKLDASSALNAVLNTQNLPTGWKNGAAVNYVFNSTRAPFIKLIQKLDFYSLPDTLKLTLNVGDISFSKLLISVRAANSTGDLTKEFNNIPLNTNTTLALPLSSLFDTSDIAIYPISLSYLNFYLNTQTESQAYTLALKDISLCYKGVQISGLANILNSDFSVFPNPVNNKELNVRFNDSYTGNVQLDLYSLAGKKIKSQSYKPENSNQVVFNLDNSVSGNYILRVVRGKNAESVKLTIK